MSQFAIAGSTGDVIKLFDEDGWLIDRYVAQKDQDD